MKIVLMISIIFSLNLSAKVLFYKDWQQLGQEEQADIINWGEYNYENLKVLEFHAPEPGVNAYTAVSEPLAKEIGNKLWSLSEDNIYMDNYDDIPELDDSYIALVGGPHQSYFRTMYLLEEGKEIFIGAFSAAHEVGCEMEGDSYKYSFFQSKLEAKSMDCVFSDISWTGHLYIDGDLKILQVDDYMEWTGW